MKQQCTSNHKTGTLPSKKVNLLLFATALIDHTWQIIIACVAAVSFPFPGREIQQESERVKECTLGEQKLGEKRAGDERVGERGGKKSFPCSPYPACNFITFACFSGRLDRYNKLKATLWLFYLKLIFIGTCTWMEIMDTIKCKKFCC